MNKTCRMLICCLAIGWSTVTLRAQPEVIFELTSPYHHIQVLEEYGFRTLSFNGSAETRMLLANPLQGHFEYTEFFHLPWLWNSQITNALMIGLGGASTQRSYEHYYPQVTVNTAELDAKVLQVAKEYFGFQESPKQRVVISDGRVFLRRTETKYGVILVDAYVQGRYGSSIPHQLATKEFFQLAANHLSTNGVVAYNVIGTMRQWRANIVGSLYRTMKSVFPQVYAFPAKESYNVVLVGSLSRELLDATALWDRAKPLVESKRITLPTFHNRVLSLQTTPPLNYERCPILTDDYAPVDGLLSGAP